MRTAIVLTLTGPDRVGIVEEVTKVLLEQGGNVETSRMARLGGEFAMLMLVSVPAEGVPDIGASFEHLIAEGYKLTLSQTAAPQAAETSGLSYRVVVRGADHEGIIHEIARGLAAAGINIESMETGTSRASVTGMQLFTMNALVSVPTHVGETDWMTAVVDAGQQSGVDVEIAAADGE